jgi:hypothetical protein
MQSPEDVANRPRRWSRSLLVMAIVCALLAAFCFKLSLDNGIHTRRGKVDAAVGCLLVVSASVRFALYWKRGRQAGAPGDGLQ